MAFKLLVALLLFSTLYSSVVAKKQSISLRLAYKKGHIVGSPGYPVKPASYATFYGSLYDFKTNKPVGYSVGTATIMPGKNSPRGCVFTYALSDGDISVVGDMDESEKVKYVPVAGGSRKYQTARGQAVLSYIKPKLADSVLEFKVILELELLDELDHEH